MLLQNSTRAGIPGRKKRLTIRLAYWHQHLEGKSREHHDTLAKLFQDYLKGLNNQRRQKFSWDCQPVHVRPGITRPDRVVSVQVDFVHQIYTHQAIEAPVESRRLWVQLLQLLRFDEFRGLFGGDMICMNIYAIRVTQEWKITYAQGRMVQNLAIDGRTTVHAKLEPRESSMSVLSRGVILRIITPYITPREIGGPSAPRQGSHIENLARIKNFAAQSITTIRNTYKSYESNKSDSEAAKRALEKIVQTAAESGQVFNDAFVATTSRVEAMCKKNRPSGEDIWETIVAIRTMLLLYPGLDEGSRSIMSLLKSKENENSGSHILSVGIITLNIAVFLVPGGSLLHTSLKIITRLLDGVGILSTLWAWIKRLLGGSEIKNVEQLKKSFQDSMMKLCFYTAACWVEDIWQMDFESIPVSRKEELLRSFGVDPAYFGEKEYRMAFLEDIVKKMKRDYNDMQKSVASMFEELNVSAETEYWAPGN